MIKIDENGISCTKGDIFNLLVVPDHWDADAVYASTATIRGRSVNFQCSMFRDKYVRIFSNAMTLDEGIGTFVMTKDGTEIMNKPFIVKEVAHNG